MSVKVMNAIWEQAMDLDGSRLLVMLALADWANDEGVCWPGMETVARKARISRATAFRVMSELEAEGYIERSKRSGHSSVFRVHPAPLARGSHSETGPTGTAEGSRSETQEVSPVRPTRLTGETQNHQEPPTEPSENLAADAAKDVLPFSSVPLSAQRRKRDVIWDAVMFVCGISGEIPRSARGAYNRAVADLKAVGATPDDVMQRAAVYRATWPEVSLTPTALARRWSECEQFVTAGPARRLRQQAEVVDLSARMQALDAQEAQP